MNKRIVLWIVFLMSLLLLWERWQTFNGRPSMFFPNATQVVKTDATKNATLNSTSPLADGTNSVSNLPSATSAVPVQGETITIITDLYKAEIDTVGGELFHLELLKQKQDVDTSFGSGWKSLFKAGKTAKEMHDEAPNVVLFDRSDKRTYLAQTGLLDDAKTKNPAATLIGLPNHKSLFTAQPGLRTLDDSGQVQLVLEAEQNGVKLVKTYTFKKGSYSIDLTHQIINASAAPVTSSLYMQIVRDGGKLEGETRFIGTSSFIGPAVYNVAEHKVEMLTFEKIEKGSKVTLDKADSGWVAMIQHYFVSGIIPQDKLPREFFMKKLDGINLFAVGNIIPINTLAPGATESVTAQIYSGPLVTSLLEKVAPGFELTKDYGWTAVVAKPVFWLMNAIHDLLGNWGWTIIVLTLCIKLVFFPLSAASFRSMGKMKLLTPKMTAIRERHKEDPQKMNQAMMELYKTEKVNPLGGCLPILIQTPVFMALYSVVLASVELRNAPWLGWIHDLSTPDPFLLLPVLMAVSMFIQTKLNPAPADPMQAKMMMIMPLVFSVMFFFFPSGLVLYWVVNNVLSIAQQWVITKNMAVAK